MTLPAFAAAAPCCCGAAAAGRPAGQHGQQSIDVSCPPGAQQQTRRTLLQRSTDGTDRRTDTGPLHRPCSAQYVGSANNTKHKLGNKSCKFMYFARVEVAVDSSHMTALSSASWSRFGPPSNFVNGHVSTMWFMVCRWPQSQEGDWAS